MQRRLSKKPTFLVGLTYLHYNYTRSNDKRSLKLSDTFLESNHFSEIPSYQTFGTNSRALDASRAYSAEIQRQTFSKSSQTCRHFLLSFSLSPSLSPLLSLFPTFFIAQRYIRETCGISIFRVLAARPGLKDLYAVRPRVHNPSSYP